MEIRKKTPAEIFNLDAFLKEGEELLDQAPYDTAICHYQSDEYPKDLSPSAAYTHLGMYLGWAIDRGLISDNLLERFGETIERFRKREISSSEIFQICCGDELSKEHFNNEGNTFSRNYYRPGWKYSYTHDYDVLTGWPNKRGFFNFENSWKNFDQVKAMIDKRYAEWKQE